MPTYAFRCPECGRVDELVMSISDYIHRQPTLFCHGDVMQRFINVVPALAIDNALASERHYEGLRATDGTPIDTRAKHRAYMKAHNLTTIDDFQQTWKREADARAARLAGDDPMRARDIVEAIQKLGG
jgi:hypothetical protein